MVTTAFFAPLIGAWKGAAAVKIVKTAMVTAVAGSHLLPHGESVEVDHGSMHSHGEHTDHLEHSHADPADHGDHGHDEHHEEHHEDHEEHEHDDHEHEHEHEDHEHEEEGDEMEETVEAAEFAQENGAVSGGPQFWRSFQKRSQSHPKPSPESASATNAEAVLKAVAAAAAVASVTSRMVESRCQELRCRPKQRNDAAGAAARVGPERRKPWRSCGDPFPNPSGQLSMVI